jgi:hypothetical protein
MKATINFKIKICVVFSNYESNLVKEIMDPSFVISFFMFQTLFES